MTVINTNAFMPEVIVVGAGPAGLTMAAGLSQQGIKCLVIEKQEKAFHNLVHLVCLHLLSNFLIYTASQMNL